MATTYLWSQRTHNETIAFDPFQDVLRFDSTTISAADVIVADVAGNLNVTYDGKTVKLTTTLATLTIFNVMFDNGSWLRVGDNTPDTAGDADTNALSGTVRRDHLLGLGGDDTLYGGSDGDRLDGGTGFDTASYSAASSGVTANLTTPSLNTGDAAGDIYLS